MTTYLLAIQLNTSITWEITLFSYFTIINYVIRILYLTLAEWIYKDYMWLHKIYRIY